MSFGFGKQQNKKYKFEKDVTWQDREFDFTDEQKVAFDSGLVKTIKQTVQRYGKNNGDGCVVNFVFLDSQGNAIATMESHSIRKNPPASQKSLKVAGVASNTETLLPSEIIVGVKVNQDL